MPSPQTDLIHVFDARLNARKPVREQEENLIVNGFDLATTHIY